MATNAKQFTVQLDRERRMVIGKFVEFHRTLSLFALRRILDRSPVWSGRFRGSNTIQIGSADTTVQGIPLGLPNWPEPVGRTLQVRAPSMSEARRRLTGLKPFQNVFINNSLPYASAIENGHSAQAPIGVYKLALLDAEIRFRRVKLGRVS